MAIAIAMLVAGCESSDVSRDVGARCTANGQCNDECLEEFPGGFCTTLCDSDDDCVNQTHCIAIDNGVCVFGCGSDPDCTFLGGGYTCQSTDSKGAGTKDMVCLPGM
jgi:hypothetical protein